MSSRRTAQSPSANVPVVSSRIAEQPARPLDPTPAEPFIGRAGESPPAVAPVAAPFAPTRTAVTPPATLATPVDALAASDEALTPEQVTAQIKLLETSETKDEAAKKQALEQFQQALKCLELATEAARKTAEFKAEQVRAPELLQQAKVKLAARVPDAQPQYAPAATVAQLEQALRQAEDERQDARTLLDETEPLLDAKARKTELAKLKAKAKEQLEEAEKDLQFPADKSSDLPLARRIELQARRRMCRSQIEAADAEKARWEALAELFPLERDLLRRRVDNAERLLTAWRDVVAKRRADESTYQAVEARRLASQAHPTLRELAEKNVQLAERQNVVNNQLKQVAAFCEEAQKQLTELNASFKKVRDKVESVGTTPTVGLLLRTQRDHLPDPRLYRQRTRFTETEMQRVQADKWELDNDRTAIGDLGPQLELLVVQIETRAAGQFPPGYLPQMARGLFAQRRDLLDRLLVDNETYREQLTELDSVSRKLLAQIDKYADFIDGQILWIRSAAPLGSADFPAAGRAVQAWLKPGHWWQVVRDVTGLAWQFPLSGGILAGAFVLLFLGLAPVTSQISRLSEKSPVGGDGQQFLTTLQAFALTALVAAFWPAAVFAVGWWVTWSESASELTLELARALRDVAPLLFGVQLLRCVCGFQGVAEGHFGWNPDGLRKLHRRLTVLLMIGLPLFVLVPVADNFGDPAGREALGRLVLIAALLFLALTAHSLLRPRGGAVWTLLEQEPATWLYRTRPLWYVVGAVFPLLLAGVIVIGYSYSAGQLLLRWEQSLWLALGAVFAYALLSRGVSLYCRYLACRRKTDPTPVQASETTAETKPEQAEQEEVLTQAVTRLQRMLHGAALLGFLVGGTVIWSATFPALEIVTRIPLKPLTKIVSTETDDGSVSNQTVPVTLGDLLLCLVLIGGTVTLSRTIPDLLHVSVLQRLSMDRGARYAMVLMSRYTLIAIGMVLAFRPVGITWAGLQWLVAAMTVGLGFGLQEIFANFVAGIIILFERPVRIGDMITVNGTTGKVTRMQIRATTITDSDRRELIVPNKKFITDEVINWTLSDSTMRVVIPVGISYDCDPTQTAQLLVDLAKAHPLVLKDPAPNAVFKGFGNSTLDLELRVFVGNGDIAGTVLHELNVAIDRGFREAGIEMAFPQQEIRIRSLPAGLPLETPHAGLHLPRAEKAA
ncbi:MAG: mechanosensitive ion channel [Planctomycetota bacterium]|nr:mechanosensitive ion channel [Planctomycetota bacterium]